MESNKKAMHYLANYQALSNAAEMIRQHGEEGFQFEDEEFNKVYMTQKKKLAKQLDARAQVFSDKYQELGIDIDCEINMGY